MKKLFAALLAVLMVFGCVPCITAAETANTLDEFDTALNAAGGSLDFTNDETNPWLFCADADGSENGAVRSNIASMNDTETMFTFTASVQAGERLRFDLKLSTEDEYDTFRLYDNGYPVMYRCGSTDWYTEVYTITESGEHTFSFAYSKDASGEDGEDTVFVDNVAVLATDPNALSLNAVLNAEGCNHEYVTERSEWIPAVYNERECAKSNIEYQNDGVATLYTECYLEAGAGITFEYAASSEEDFDNLYFSAINLDNGTEYEHELTMTGDVDWTNAAWGVPETGNYRLIFTYEKDGGGYSGADSVYVTNVFVPNAAVGEVKWSTSFEDENPLFCGWTTIDADGDGLAFAWTRDLEHFLYGRSVSYDGKANMASASYDEGFAMPRNPDEYLVSPAATIGADNTSVTLKVAARGQDKNEACAEHFQILVSESATDFANADVVYEGTTVHDWMFYAADLTPYIGRTVYIAIRHFDSEDMYYLNIDMFQIIADGSIDVAQTEPQFVYNETLANALNVEGGTLRFSTGTRFPWKVGEQNGRGFAYSMNHLPYTRSYIETRVTITEPCRLSYDWMNDAEQGMDFPTLYINGEVAVEMKYVYGEFRTQIVDITEPGEYTFAWGFWKDEEINEGSDAAYIDNIAILEAVHPASVVTSDFVSVNAGASASISCTDLPADTTIKDVAWSSSHENIAVVNANGIVRGIAPGHAVITASTVDGGLVSRTFVTVCAAAEPQTFYGYRYSDTTGTKYDLVSFSENEPGTITTIASLPNSFFTAMEYFNGKVYAARNCTIYTMELDNPVPEVLHEEYQADVELLDMTYNYADSTMYVLAASGLRSAAVFTLDTETGAVALRTAITGMNLAATTLAIDANGNAYCTELYTDRLYSLNLTTGEATVIGSITDGETGEALVGARNLSLTFDLNTGRLFWARYYYDGTTQVTADGLYEINPVNAKANYLGDLGGSQITELVGMFTVPANDMQTLTVSFIDSITGEVVNTQNVARGTVLSEMPEAAAHEGWLFLGWNYDNSPVVGNISVFARYGLMGDADADGALTVFDALMILRHAMGLSELPENRIALCDFDNSGDISAADALTAMRNAL